MRMWLGWSVAEEEEAGIGGEYVLIVCKVCYA